MRDNQEEVEECGAAVGRDFFDVVGEAGEGEEEGEGYVGEEGEGAGEDGEVFDYGEEVGCWWCCENRVLQSARRSLFPGKKKIKER